MKKATYESRKEFSAKDSMELYDYFSNESHIISSGIVKGLPTWVPWFIAKEHDSKTEEGYYVYNTTQEEREICDALTNCQQVILKFDDMRHLQKGFRCYVIQPEGIAVPDYDTYDAEWKTYFENKVQEQKTKRKKREQKIKKTKEEESTKSNSAGYDSKYETQTNAGQAGTSDEG